MQRPDRLRDLSTGQEFDLIFFTLLLSDNTSLLPELYEVFGREKLMKFLELFGGTQIKVPSFEAFQEAAVKADIFRTMLRSRSDSTVAELADLHNISEPYVRQAFKDMSDVHQDLQLVRSALGGTQPARRR